MITVKDLHCFVSAYCGLQKMGRRKIVRRIQRRKEVKYGSIRWFRTKERMEVF